jgi:hypothetical protein
MGDEAMFEIKIIPSAQTGGAKEAAAALNQTAQATTEQTAEIKKDSVAVEDAAKKSEFLTLKKSELKKAAKELGHTLPELGMAMRVFLNPVTAVVFIALKGIAQMKEGIKGLMQTVSETAEWVNMTEVVKQNKAALAAAATEADRYEKSLLRMKTAADTATESAQRLAELQKAKQTAEERVDEAQRAKEVARTKALYKDPVEQAAKLLEIEERYANKKSAREERGAQFQNVEKHRLLANEEIDAERLRIQLKQERAKQDKLGSEEMVSGRIKVEQDRLQAQEEMIKKHEARAKELEDIPWLKRSTPEQYEMNKLNEEILPGERDTAEKLKAYIARLEKEAPGKIRQIKEQDDVVRDIEGKRKGAEDRADKLRREISTADEVNKIEKGARTTAGAAETSTRRIEAAEQIGQTPIGKLAGQDMAGALDVTRALDQGKSVGADSKEQLIQVASAIAGHRVTLQQAVQMMHWAAKDMGNFSQDVLKLAGVMGQIAQGHATVSGRIDALAKQVEGLQARMRGAALP